MLALGAVLPPFAVAVLDELSALGLSVSQAHGEGQSVRPTAKELLRRTRTPVIWAQWWRR